LGNLNREGFIFKYRAESAPLCSVGLMLTLISYDTVLPITNTLNKYF